MEQVVPRVLGNPVVQAGFGGALLGIAISKSFGQEIANAIDKVKPLPHVKQEQERAQKEQKQAPRTGLNPQPRLPRRLP